MKRSLVKEGRAAIEVALSHFSLTIVEAGKLKREDCKMMLDEINRVIINVLEKKKKFRLVGNDEGVSQAENWEMMGKALKTTVEKRIRELDDRSSDDD
jgi:nucleoid DNA-binding protein